MFHKTLFIAALLITGMSLNSRVNAEEFSCPPHDSFLTCSKAVATKYQNCAEEAKKTHDGEKLNRALESCKFEAKNSKVECQNSCKKTQANVRAG
ncbi:hypothetical protein [Candidatus Odyssella acanthamoebae]|uniref:Uncharacterized protein n=1 Tax=Candidatus Odyssella acanthamoebae TaxID=91604 RepID=A0A077AUL4_9PROT|nr:hypothetical protein [Candidatus Paracaedibacter acanthamoebae]AIK96091.1 hypothetical protein ID47_04050 [Candidatus Paracaedibacter acanthamoebae]